MSLPLHALARLVERAEAGRRLNTLLAAGRSFEVGGVRTAARPLLLGMMAPAMRLPAVWVTPTIEAAERLYEDAALFFHLLDREDEADLVAGDTPADEARTRIALFPEREHSIFDEGASDPERLRVLQALSSGVPTLVITPVMAILQKTMSPQTVAEEGVVLRRGAEIALEKLLGALVERGYTREPMVELRGQFSVRGGIIDIYPSTGDPVRVELFGDEIDSMRNFHLDTQRSIGDAAPVTILPLREHDAAAWLTAYLPESAYVILEEPARLKLRADEWAADVSGVPPVGSDASNTWQAVEEMLGRRPRISLSSWGATEASADVFIPTEAAPQFSARLDAFTADAAERAAAKQRVVVVTQQARRICEIFAQERGVACVNGLSEEPRPGEIYVVAGHLSEGFSLHDLCVITDRELLGTSRRRRYIRTAERGSLLRLEDLKPGDVVVHAQHGIGRYQGVRTLEIEGSARDFIKLDYAKGDNLFVPVEQFDMVSKYSGVEAGAPPLSRLGRGEWQKNRAKVSEEVQQMAENLLRVHAQRVSGGGHAFPPDSAWQEELEAAFPFEETPDQAKAIERVKDDMEQPVSMDRLVCGDVGYGKTEVAIRAAFKAVMDGRQVAVLVPTTVLAQQHYNTFRERMAPYPVRVEVLSRFRSPKEQKAVLEALEQGQVDVVVGTHRLLSKDAKFKKLGLLIVDEEQHFGVAHKERLKQLRATVDILTMTATPIPRTLQMALMGMRDLSLITTPPMHRLPIKTYLFESMPEIVRGAIMRELEREGQIFFVHNRVHGIEKVANDIRKLVPQARVTVGHGQMSEDLLEKVMLDFVEGEFDILVCTTIIESGLDIPTVNTIIINNAHMFGLGQLYQLRGRVGRAHHQAYCYLLYPPHRGLTEEAEQRLDTIREFTALGSGYQIAMRDLEIRGAGNLLGPEQSGQIAAVGFELYCQMLEDAVAGLKGERRRHVVDEAPVIDFPVEAFLSEQYVSDARQKITLYKRLAEMRELSEVELMREELRDRFGPLPPEAEKLLDMVAIKALCLELGIPSIKFRKTVVERTIAILVPFARPLTARDTHLLGREIGASVAYKSHLVLITEMPQNPDYADLVLRVLRWIQEHAKT
ncbi:MAG: transcription-repair coupling factor [Armatimonadetes bacterium]|nr:transcription-repair coupling factor [Armatimonadota bacterium]